MEKRNEKGGGTAAQNSGHMNGAPKGGPGGHGRMGAKPQNLGKTIKRILTYMGKYRGLLIVVMAMLVFSSLANVVGAYFMKPAINDYILPFIGKKNPDMSGLLNLIIVIGSLYTAGALASYVYQRIMVTISSNTLTQIRQDMFSHMQKLPIRYFDTQTHGEIMSRYTNDVDSLRQLLSQSLVQLISSGISIVGVFIGMLILSPLLTSLAILMLAVMVYIVMKLGKKSGAYFREQQSALGNANGYIEEMVEGQKVVKVFSHEGNVKKQFAALAENLFKSSEGANTFAGMLMPIMNNLAFVHYAITAMVGGLLAAAGSFDIGSLSVFLTYTRQFSQPVTQVSQQFNMVLHAFAGAERIFALLDEQPEVDEGKVRLVNVTRGEDGMLIESAKRTGLWAWRSNGGENVTYTELKGDVRFNNVMFWYDESKTVLHDLTLYAKPGQKIAFVGSTGAGKTTITNLINRFYDVEGGVITYDGINVNDISKDDLRHSLSMVLQDTHLFTGTVRENIRYGRLDATDEEVIGAAKAANAHSFIRHLPDGYDTMITGDGSNLSQGQRQLLAIARAALADPPVLILDEATSSIDTRTEAIIEKGMDQLMKGRTVFVIAHRLSTVRNSNAIIVLENGGIIERGDHDDLVAQRGRYYQLYTGAFELT